MRRARSKMRAIEHLAGVRDDAGAVGCRESCDDGLRGGNGCRASGETLRSARRPGPDESRACRRSRRVGPPAPSAASPSSRGRPCRRYRSQARPPRPRRASTTSARARTAAATRRARRRPSRRRAPRSSLPRPTSARRAAARSAHSRRARARPRGVSVAIGKIFVAPSGAARTRLEDVEVLGQAQHVGGRAGLRQHDAVGAGLPRPPRRRRRNADRPTALIRIHTVRARIAARSPRNSARRARARDACAPRRRSPRGRRSARRRATYCALASLRSLSPGTNNIERSGQGVSSVGVYAAAMGPATS